MDAAVKTKMVVIPERLALHLSAAVEAMRRHHEAWALASLSPDDREIEALLARECDELLDLLSGAINISVEVTQ